MSIWGLVKNFKSINKLVSNGGGGYKKNNLKEYGEMGKYLGLVRKNFNKIVSI